MPNVFEVTDPRGRVVMCTEECWTGHVLYNRPWMLGWEDDVAQVIEHPLMGIFRDADFENRDIYYGFNPNKKDRYIKVIVEFRGALPNQERN
jgi:hypothetical protein